MQGQADSNPPNDSPTQKAPLRLILDASALACFAPDWVAGGTPGMSIAGGRTTDRFACTSYSHLTLLYRDMEKVQGWVLVVLLGWVKTSWATWNGLFAAGATGGVPGHGGGSCCP